MSPDVLREFLRTRPFIPFRVALTDGRAFDVRHPEMLMVGHRHVVIGIPDEGSGQPLLMERSITVTLLHIVSVEPLEAPTSATDQVTP